MIINNIEEAFLKKMVSTIKKSEKKKVPIQLAQIPLGLDCILTYKDGKLKECIILNINKKKSIIKLSNFKYIENIFDDLKFKFTGDIIGKLVTDYSDMINILRVLPKYTIISQLYDNIENKDLKKSRHFFMPLSVNYKVSKEDKELNKMFNHEDFLDELFAYGFKIKSLLRIDINVDTNNLQEEIINFIKECINETHKIDEDRYDFITSEINLAYLKDDINMIYDFITLPCLFYMDKVTDITLRTIPNGNIMASIKTNDSKTPLMSLKRLLDLQINKGSKIYVQKYPFINLIYPIKNEIAKELPVLICPRCGNKFSKKDIKNLLEDPKCPKCTKK